MTTSATNTKPTSFVTSRAIAWALWGIVTFFYAFQYILRVSPSVMLDSIMQKFGLNAAHFGEFSSAYYLGYALMHIPIGLMLDRLSIKWVISGSIFISVLGILPLAVSDTWILCIIGRFFVGAGSSGAILSVFKVTRMYFPDHWFSRLLGISVTFGLMGAIYGSTPVDHLNHQVGWQNVILLFFAIGVVIAAFILMCIPSNTVDTHETSNVWQDIRAVFTNRRVLLTAFFAALMVGPLEGFADVWAVAFLETVYGYERTVATSLPSLIFIGMCVGSPLLAAIAERFKAYDESIIISASVMGVVFASLLFMRPTAVLTGVLFFVIGVFCAYQVLVMTINSKNADDKHSGLVTAMTNMIIMLFGSVFHFVITRVMNIFWDGKIVNNLAIYSADSYVYGVSVIPVALVIAFLGFWALRRARYSIIVAQ